MKRALTTGAAGFIGSNLTLELVRRGYEVVAVDNFYSGVKQNLKNFAGTFVEWDLTKPLPFEGPFDVIFHHGDITDPRYPNPEEIFERNLQCFHSVLELAKQNESKLIYASTAGLYGNGSTPMHEDQEKEILTAYGRSKLEMDKIASRHFDKMHIVGLRYFNVFGPRESHKGRAASMVYHLSRQMAQEKRPRLFNFGEQKRDFVYVKDVVEANLCAVDGKSGVYNVGTGVASTFNELVKALNTALGSNLPIEYFEMPYDSKSYQTNTQADTALAEVSLKFKSRWPLQEAVMDYLKWLDN